MVCSDASTYTVYLFFKELLKNNNLYNYRFGLISIFKAKVRQVLFQCANTDSVSAIIFGPETCITFV
jgi:hypothetical protein